LLSAVAGCGHDEPPLVRVPSIDEVGGTYRGISMGDPGSKVRRVMGAPDPSDGGEECDLCPAGTTIDDQFGVPTFIADPPGTRSSRSFRYRDVVFLRASGRVFGYLVTKRGAATRRGVAVGDSLERVRERYPQLKCGTGGDEEFPYCAGKVGRLSISFGLDPVGSITVTETRLQP
jgi:hypothetical protein